MLLRDAPPEPIRLQTAAIAPGVVLALLPDADEQEEMRESFAMPHRVPYGTVSVSHGGRSRRIAALRLGEDGAGFEPGEVGLGRMAAPLDEASRRRLLSFLLGFCRSAFRLGSSPTFASTCRRLVVEAVPCAGVAVPVARLSPGLILVRGVTVPAGSMLHLVGEQAAFPSAMRGSGCVADASWGGLQVVERPAPGSVLLADCAQPLHWVIEAEAAGLPHLLELVEAGAPGAAALRAACLAALAPLAVAGSAEAALVSDIQLVSPVPARVHDDPAAAVGGALELAVADEDGGIFLRGWFRDPLGLVSGLSLLTVAGAEEIAPEALHRVRRPDLAKRLAAAAHGQEPRPGFLARVVDPSRGHTRQPQVLLRLRSGAMVILAPTVRSLDAAAARDAVLGSVDLAEAGTRLFDGCIAPATRALHSQALRERGTPTVTRIGRQVVRPEVSLLVPVYRNLGFLRAQMAALSGDPGLRRTELVLALDSPEQQAELEHLLRGLHLLHDFPVTLVVMARNCGFAAATNAAAEHARAPVLMMLNSDVVPARPGWLSMMLAALRSRGVGAVGPKLLFDDDSIQHAGMHYERDTDGIWFNRHYHKGMPRSWAPAMRARRVPGVTGGALMLRASSFAAVGGVCEDYVIGDYEDSDLCLRLQGRGETIAYVPGAELYHFERRSMSLHGGYSRTLASSYNRRLHHLRWDAAMESVMRAARGRDAAGHGDRA